jgi:purine-binding chemotaxis protein CheW
MDMKNKKNSSNSYLTFELENELYAVHFSNVLNILDLTTITKVPKSPEYFVGVMNLPGVVLPVVDLHLKFGLKISEYTVNTCIIVMNIKIEDELIMVGIIVDSVQEVIEIEQINLISTSNISNKYKPEFNEGIVYAGNKLIKVLNMEKVFSIEDIVTLNKQGL